MHRAKNGGLRLTDEGLTVSSWDRRDSLRILGGFEGNDSDGARFIAVMAFGFDAAEMEKLRRWRTAYLARYMRQPLDILAETPITELWSYVRELTDLIKSETMASMKED